MLGVVHDEHLSRWMEWTEKRVGEAEAVPEEGARSHWQVCQLHELTTKEDPGPQVPKPIPDPPRDPCTTASSGARGGCPTFRPSDMV